MLKKICLFLLFFQVMALGAIKITGAEVEKHKYYDNIYIKTSEYILPKARIFNDKLIFDFKGAEVTKAKTIEIENNPRIQSIRFGQFSANPMIARVVFDLKSEIEYDFSAILGKDYVMVEVISKNKSAVKQQADKKVKISAKAIKGGITESVDVTHKLRSMLVKSLKEKPDGAETFEAVKIEKPATSLLAGKKIVVDAGHGGNDPGAISPNGIFEKEINLKVALILENMLKKKGAKVYMIRRSDKKVQLKDIVEFNNSIGADAYIGVHFNSMFNAKANGTETHYYTSESYNLASAVHKRILKGIRRQDRGLRKTMLYTIHHSYMPAIIVEPIYMTHFQDGLLINSKSFQKELARDITMGIEDFFNGK
ncbi:MAG: N-acetylmuramoyl-L-alanine amidase [Candidatus Saganbacteria bacterium]|uniref:N-acetylmuramoyl-L-alanine amidase n=1 Tax=Candidatus Saganbacteria bacterium TaxID=2575572 RepID=A0A833L1F1_UNCSA|nr:MAG: N-acetylmuramoyl-L-alanine amidase [Candidatus Saganbacteria bacterium]